VASVCRRRAGAVVSALSGAARVIRKAAPLRVPSTDHEVSNAERWCSSRIAAATKPAPWWPPGPPQPRIVEGTHEGHNVAADPGGDLDDYRLHACSVCAPQQCCGFRGARIVGGTNVASLIGILLAVAVVYCIIRIFGHPAEDSSDGDSDTSATDGVSSDEPD